MQENAYNYGLTTEIFYYMRRLHMAKNQLEDFRNKSKIIVTFNSSRSHFEAYKKFKDVNPEKAEDELNTSGVKLYEVFEWSLKHYLYKRYQELVSDGRISQYEASKKKEGLLKSRFFLYGNSINVTTEYLCDEMMLYADPAMDTASLDRIKNNRWGVNNGQKHIALSVDPVKYQESFKEIRSIILKYIDSNAPIQAQQSPEYGKLQQANGFWKKNPRYDLALVIDHVESLSKEELELIAAIPWRIVFDFNMDSIVNGLLKAYESLFGYQPNYFNPSKPSHTKFNSMAESPYWFFINGRSDLPNTLATDKRRWRQKYQSELTPALKAYHKVFPKQLRLVIVDGEYYKICELVTAIDTCYEDDYKISFLPDETQFESLCEDYEEVLTKYPMDIKEFVSGLNNFSSLLGLKREKTGYNIIGKDGNVSISLERYSHLTILHDKIANEPEDFSKKEEFLKAKEPISWYGIKKGYAISRNKQFSAICGEITERCRDLPYSILEIRHDPGAGGTTLARQIAYHMSKTYPVVLLKCFEENVTGNQIGKLYDKVKMSIVIFAENVIIDDDIEKLHIQLKANLVPHVIVYVKRIDDRRNLTDKDLSILTDDEFADMKEKLQDYMDDNTEDKLHSIEDDPTSRIPFLMSLYVFDEKFEGIEPYVSRFLSVTDDYDRNILGDIAIVDIYAESLIPLSFFALIDEFDEFGIFKNNVNDNLIALVGEKVKIRHPLIAKELINQIISRGESNLSDIQKGERLADFVIGFIKRSKLNNFIDYDSTISILKDLLITRNSEGIIKDDFSPIITKIRGYLKYASGDEKHNAIGRIFKSLEQIYPEEAHFKAHLSRFYTNIEQNYERGIETAKDAINLSENEGITDALLYHIYGVSERKYVERKLFSLVDDEKVDERIINEIRNHLSKASEAFRKTRDINHKSAGFISDIDMCISVIDFAKRIYNCSTQELIEQHKDSWTMEYFDRAISLMESFNSMQTDEDAEFQLNRLAEKFDAVRELENCLEKTIEMWKEYLAKADESNKPLARRFVARAMRNSFEKNHDQGNINSILELMERNIDQEPNNEANIRIWFNALRYLETNSPELFLDEALSKLAIWKSIGGNREAYYYHFILTCIKAIENSSMAESQIPFLLHELKDKTKNMPNKNIIYEWLGKGTGVQRLFNCIDKGKGRVRYDIVSEKGAYLDGVVTHYANERNATITSHGMDVFFTPFPTGQASPSITKEDVGKRVRFIPGFSYDGVRALNKSVQIIDSDYSDEDNNIIGKKVKCRVTSINLNYEYVNVKLIEYRNKTGSISKAELPKGKKVSDYREKDIFYAQVIGEKNNKGKVYYDLSLLDEELLLDDWQRKLRELKRTL